jgi:hypothetical protein
MHIGDEQSEEGDRGLERRLHNNGPRSWYVDCRGGSGHVAQKETKQDSIKPLGARLVNALFFVVSLFLKSISRITPIPLRHNAPVAIFLLLLAVVSLNTSLPKVKAQSTNITDVSYPARAKFDLQHRTTDPPLLVKATVSYSGANPEDFLSVSIFDLDSGNLARGTGSAAPEPCNSNAGYAICLMGIRSSSGIEFVEFLLVGFKPTMSFAIVALLFNSTGSMIYESESDYEFAIVMTSSLALSIRVPGIVSVSVDGAQQPEGNVRLNLIPGVHRISVPETAQLDNMTRLKFEHWSDGVNETSRAVQLDRGMMLAAIYTMQYLLAARSPQAIVSGAGWYNDESNATFSVPSTTLRMDGMMGLLGGKWRFQGWYENEELLTTSINGSIVMRQPHSLTAKWEPDYTLPALVFTIAALLILVLYVRRKTGKIVTRN